jgi:HAD superfamily hydrolase (TIGR01549 family)
MKLRAVLWDKDGTLLDGFAAWIRRDLELARRLTVKIRGDVLPVETAAAIDRAALAALGVVNGKVLPIGLLAHGTEEALLLALRETLSAFTPMPQAPAFHETARLILARILEEEGPRSPNPCPGATAALEIFARRGFIQGLATSDSLARSRAEFEQLGWTDRISYWGCGDTVQKPKPDPWLVHDFCKQKALEPDEVVVIGDAPADAEMARRAGAMALGVLGGVGGKDDLADCHRIFPDLHALVEWMERDVF